MRHKLFWNELPQARQNEDRNTDRNLMTGRQC